MPSTSPLEQLALLIAELHAQLSATRLRLAQLEQQAETAPPGE